MLHGMSPWIAASEYQLVEKIKNCPLKLDSQLKDTTKDFLKRCLEK